MRLCYFAPAHSIHTQRWLRAFVELGHEVHLIALPDEPADSAGIMVHRLPIGRPKIRFVQSILAGRRMIRQIQPDIVHGHYLTRYGWLAALTFFHPLALTAWGTDVYIDPDRSRLAHGLTRWTLQRADLITADAADLRERVIALGARSDRTHLAQWGIDTRVFRPDLDASDLRRQLNLSNGPIVLSTRGLLPHYNQDTIVRALPAVLNIVPDVTLIIKYHESQPDHLARLRMLVTELGLEKATRFVGATPHNEMAQYYTLADVFVSMASSDSTPVSLLEAMACGAAPVVSDLPSIGEWITTGQNGICVPPRDSAALSAALVRLFNSPELCRQFAQINRRLIEEKANHRLEMQRVEKLYTALISENEVRSR